MILLPLLRCRPLPLVVVLLALAPTSSACCQTLCATPRLVVTITVDQLRSDYLEHFSPLYGSGGFRRLLTEGRVYTTAYYPFSPVDGASACACLATGTTPQYNKIVAQQWYNCGTKKTTFCVYDKKNVSSPENMACGTLSDELKISSDGKALVYAVAPRQEEAILAVGHAADGAFWLNDVNGVWSTSAYYPRAAQLWVQTYNSQHAADRKLSANEALCACALHCLDDNAMGKDDTTDYLSVTLSAAVSFTMGRRGDMENTYVSLDRTLANFISNIENRVGKDHVLFVVTSSGHFDEPVIDYAKYKIPTGTFYINRTSQLLNMYLSAIYGSGTWVEGFYKNQIFLNHKLIESNKTNFSELVARSKDLLRSASGVVAVDDSPYDYSVAGDLWIRVAPGWKIVNEETNERYQFSPVVIPFPVIFLGDGIPAATITTPITADYVAATIAKAIRIRAPNACTTLPLF